METKITKGIIEDHLHCRYKGYLKNNGIEGKKTEYEILRNELREKYLSDYRKELNRTTDTCYDSTRKLTVKDFQKGYDYIFNGTIKLDNISFRIDALKKVHFKNKKTKLAYIPILFSANEKFSKIDKELISCVSYLLGTQITVPAYGKIIYGKNLQSSKVKVGGYISGIKEVIKEINSDSEPQLILNDHCQICEYNAHCRTKAKKEDNLSLLDRATPKTIGKYHKKGIFTIQQLSHLYRPRRSRKRRANQPILHNLEVQALALRTNKIYVQQLPDIARKPVELFLDIEGIPNRESYYLIGLLIVNEQQSSYVSFWADRDSDEVQVWQDLILELNKYPDAPIYHYGSYEQKAMNFLGKRFDTNVKDLLSRSINMTNMIYGKIYFPVYSLMLRKAI